jgi:steroid delta-isomerase-like uncharacterized protein
MREFVGDQGASACQEKGVAMSTVENKTVIRRFYEDLWNAWNLDLVDELIAPDITFRGSLGVSMKGRDGFRDYVAVVRTVFPDFHNTVEQLIAEDDVVAARLTYRGTHRGTLFQVPPTYKQVGYAGSAIFRIGGGLITDGFVLGDTLSLMRQIGALRADV